MMSYSNRTPRVALQIGLVELPEIFVILALAVNDKSSYATLHFKAVHTFDY